MTIRFPWPSYRDLWSVTFDAVRVDEQPRTDLVDAARRRLRLDELEQWTAVSLDVTASSEEAPPEGVDAISGLIIVTSRRANTRVPFRLEPVVPEGNCYGGTITLRRSALAGTAELALELGARIGDRHRLIGRGGEWTIVVDPTDAPAPPGRPPFEMVWVDFRAANAPSVAQQQPESYAVLDISTAKPILLLNDGINGLKDLLMPPTAVRERRRVREIISTTIARQVTSTLIRAATAEVVPDDDPEAEPSRPGNRFQLQACEAVAGAMTAVSSVDEFYERVAHAARGNPNEQAQLWAEIDAAIDRLTNHSAAVAKAVEEIKLARVRND